MLGGAGNPKLGLLQAASTLDTPNFFKLNNSNFKLNYRCVDAGKKLVCQLHDYFSFTKFLELGSPEKVGSQFGFCWRFSFAFSV